MTSRTVYDSSMTHEMETANCLANDIGIHLPVESSFEVSAESDPHLDPSLGPDCLRTSVFCCILFVEKESHYVSQAGPELVVSWPHPS